MNKRAFLLILLMAVPVLAASISSVGVAPCLVVKGQDCTIDWWSSGPGASQVNITIWLNGVKSAEILNVPNAQGHNEKVWAVPASLPTGKYIFRVTSTDGLAQAQSENYVDQEGLVLAQSPSGTLMMGAYITFFWHGFGLGLSQTTYHDLYRNGVLVGRIGSSDMSHSSGCGRGSAWTVGQLIDPNTEEIVAESVPVGGGYKIRVSNMSFTYHDESAAFSITGKIDPGKFFGHLRRIRRIPVFPEPGCPQCGKVQLNDLLEVIKSEPGADVVELWHAGRSLGKLIESNMVRGNRSMQRIDFGNSFQQLKNGGSGFELRIFDNRGKLLHTQAVVLNYKER